MDKYVARLALAIYGGISVGAAGLFLAATTFAGDYPPVARFGGAAWVLILTLIVTMPLVIPRVKARAAGGRVRPDSE